MYLTYAAPRGHALIDRALYLPRCWTEDPERCDEAGIPADSRGFATKPTLAAGLITRAVNAKVPAAWVTGDEVYGADPKLRAAIRGHGLGYVLAVAANRRVPTAAGPVRVDRLPAELPAWAWQKHSARPGSHGQRYYSWAWIALDADTDTDTGCHHLLIRRNDTTGELAYLRCYSPRPAPLRTLVSVAGQRWRIEESFQAAKGLTGLDQHQVLIQRLMLGIEPSSQRESAGAITTSPPEVSAPAAQAPTEAIPLAAQSPISPPLQTSWPDPPAPQAGRHGY